jgi:hypothetical protein
MILVNGCSFSTPSDVDGAWVAGFYKNGLSPFKHGLPINSFQYNVVRNVSAGGTSNMAIRRKTFWYLNDSYNVQKPDYAIIQWSTIDRWDYPVFVTEDKAKNYPFMDMFPERINKINYMNNGTDVFGFAKDFYEKYYSLYGAVLETLENIYHTQKYLEERNIPYKMITIGNLFDMDTSVEKLKNLQKNPDKLQIGNYANLKTNNGIFEKLEALDGSWHELNILNALIDKIDFTKFLFTDDVNIRGFGGGIIEWFLNKNEMLTGGRWHPDGEQHMRFFDEFLWPKIKDEINAITKQNTNKRLLI